VTLDAKLVEAVLRDRAPYGWRREDAERAATRYENWLRDLNQTPAPSDKGLRTLQYVLDRCLLRPGRGAALYGAQGKGKTNVLAVVTQLVLRYRPEWDVFTNVPYPWWAGAGPVPARLHLTESLSDLLAGLSRRTLEGRWSAVIIDEFDQVDTSHSWASAGSESWAKYLFVARHYLTRGPLVVFHSFHYIPLTIRGGSVGSPFKLVVRNGERVIADLENPDGAWVGTYPESDLPFLTFGLRGFRLDVDVQELESRFTGSRFAGDVTAVAETTLGYLTEEGARKKRRQETLQKEREYRASRAEGRVIVEERIASDLLAGRTYREILARYRVSPAFVADVRKRLIAEGRFALSASGARAPRAREAGPDSSGKESG
jgi:hypothetical protein